MGVEIQITSLELIHAARSSCVHISSVILRKLLYVLQTLWKILNERSVWQQFWELSNQTYTKFPYSAKGVVYKYRRRTTAWCVTHRDNGQPFDDITQQRIGEVLLNIFVGSLYLLMLNGLTVLVYLLLLQLRALNHREQSRNWWIVPLAYMLAIAPIISALCVVIIKIR